MKNTNYDEYFEKYDVPENLKNIAISIMKRFTITGLCDGMYICNSIAFYSGTGDGNSHFTSGIVNNIPTVAKNLQYAYGCNIFEEDIAELEEILRTGTLDKEKTIAGLKKFIAARKKEKRTCDSWRVTYLDRCISEASGTLLAM